MILAYDSSSACMQRMAAMLRCTAASALHAVRSSPLSTTSFMSSMQRHMMYTISFGISLATRSALSRSVRVTFSSTLRRSSGSRARSSSSI